MTSSLPDWAGTGFGSGWPRHGIKSSVGLLSLPVSSRSLLVTFDDEIIQDEGLHDGPQRGPFYIVTHALVLVFWLVNHD